VEFTHEGVWEDDFHEPPRYFSFYLIDDLLEIVQAYFKVETYHEIPADQLGGGKHSFQSLLLENPSRNVHTSVLSCPRKNMIKLEILIY